jgi:hypothetical protein
MLSFFDGEQLKHVQVSVNHEVLHTQSTPHNFQVGPLYLLRGKEREDAARRKDTRLCVYTLANEKSPDTQLENL